MENELEGDIRFKLSDTLGISVNEDGDIRIYNGYDDTLIVKAEMHGWLTLIRDQGFLTALEAVLSEVVLGAFMKEQRQLESKIQELEAELKILKQRREGSIESWY